jgi:hypothetical protein
MFESAAYGPLERIDIVFTEQINRHESTEADSVFSPSRRRIVAHGL